MKTFTPEADAKLRIALKRCTPATLAAARTFRQTGDPDCLPPLVCGLIERYLEPGLRPRLNPSDGQVRLAEDLGLDSLTRMEIGLLAEEVLELSLDAEDLRPLRTVGDVQALVAEAAGRLHGAVRAAAAAHPHYGDSGSVLSGSPLAG